MNISIFLKGLLVGFLVSTPVGPIAVLCIQRTLNKGRFHGIVSGLGAATADVVYGFIAAFGLTFISNFLVKEQLWLRLLGGFFICYMGVRIFLSKLEQRTTQADSTTYVRDYVSAFFLTLTNPITFFAFAATFAGLGLVRTVEHHITALLLVAGVFVGSGLWWLILNCITATFLGKLLYGKPAWLNKVSGIVIIIFGLFVLLTLII
jgi:threonine/homoserine/homoserine lactone efflux protein